MIKLDLNSPEFQTQLFALERTTLFQVVKAFDRLLKLAWADIDQSSGLKWEKIGRTARNGEPLYSLRITEKIRAVGFREGDYLRLVSLHPDHDSACD